MPQPPHRRRQNPPHPACPPEEHPQPPPDPRAEQDEIGRSSQHQRGGDVQPHPPVPQDDGTEEQGPTGPHPEQQVHPLLEPAPGQEQADLAQQVIQQAHPHPHGQALGQHHDLPGQGNAHPRSSRPRKPSRTGASSS